MTIDFKSYITAVPDFPKEGVMFRDISPLLRDALGETVEAMTELIEPTVLQEVDYFLGIDARGFIFAPAIAAKTGKGFLMARKAGKAPPPMIKQEYDLEYGTAALELPPGSGNVIVVDDVLATGGTLSAAADLCHAAGYKVKDFLVVIDLQFLNNFSWQDLKAKSLIQYDS